MKIILIGISVNNEKTIIKIMPTGIYIRKNLTDTHKKNIGLANKGKKHSEEFKKKCSDRMKGKILSKKTREKLSIAAKGRIVSVFTRIKLSRTHKQRVLEGKNNFYRGGITEINKKIRMSLAFRLWREAVFARDNWTCQECGSVGTYLHPHHIKSFSKYPELRFDINNGMTLCKECHKKTDNYAKNI